MTKQAMKDALHGYAADLWQLFPCRSKTVEWTDKRTGEVKTAATKTPLVKWREAATSDPRQIERWMAQFPGCMWGVATGKASGFWALDLDKHGDFDGVESVKRYAAEHEFTIPKARMQKTAGGGYHMLFKMPEGVDVQNATGVLPGVDVRGNGGYIIIAPSINQDTGKAYAWINAAPISNAPEWLLELICKENDRKVTPAENATQAGAQAHTGAGAGTPYGQKALADEIAELRRATEGTRNDALNRAAVKLFALADGGELNADVVTTELEAAAASIGLPYSEAAATIASARKAASPRTAPKAERVQATDTGTMIQEEPLPLRRPSKPQAEYPAACFFEFGQAIVDIAAATQTSTSMVGSTMLAVLSFLTQGLANVRTAKYITPLTLFFLIVGETGDGKSTVENILAKCIKEKEKFLLQEYDDQRKNYEIELKAYNRELKALENKSIDRESYKRALTELEKTRPKEPKLPVFIVGDTNIEGLYRKLKEGFPYIGIFTDEGARLFGGTAFSKENAMKTIGNLAALWSGGALDKMRGGEGTSKLYDRRVCSSIMVQPNIAQMLFADTLLTGQGYLCRQLITWPATFIKEPEQVEIERLPSVQNFYAACERLLALPIRTNEQSGGIIFDDLSLSSDAGEAYGEFFSYIEEHRQPGAEYEPVNGYAKRAAEQALRLAGVLSMALDAANRVITLEVMEAGIKLAEWYLDEILRITLDDMASPEVLQAEKLLHWLHERQIKQTAVKQILQYGPSSLREKKAVEPVIKMLEDHGWLISQPEGGLVLMGSKESFARKAWKVVYAVQDKDRF